MNHWIFSITSPHSRFPLHPPVRWWCGGYCAPTKSTVYGAAFGAYPIGTCSVWGWILTATMAHFIAFSASLWWEIYFCGSCFWEKLQFKKDSLEGLDDMCVRYIHWDYVTDCWMIALKLAAGSALCRYLPTVRCQSVVSQLFHDLWIGPAWDQNLLSAISGDCNQKDAGTFWTCWWITRWRHLKVQPFSNV